MNPVFELYRADGVLQLDLASSLPITLGRVDTNQFNNGAQRVVGSVNIPAFQGRRPWFCIEGNLRNSIQSSMEITLNGTLLSFNLLVGTEVGPYIKYGVY